MGPPPFKLAAFERTLNFEINLLGKKKISEASTRNPRDIIIINLQTKHQDFARKPSRTSKRDVS